VLKQARFTESQIVDILSQAGRDDVSARDVCRIHCISEQTYYRWKRRYGDMTVSEVKRLRELEAENARLKRLLAERDLEIDVVKDVLRGK
jgi:putative transposase